MTDSDKKKRKREAMKRIRAVEAILRRWDPILVKPGEFAPADEYDDYAPHIVSMVAQGCSLEDLTRHLGHVRTRIIGVEEGPEQDREAAVEILRALRFPSA